MVSQGSIELHQLVDRLVALHPSGSVDEHHVNVCVTSVVDRLHRDSCRVLPVAFLVQLHHWLSIRLSNGMKGVETTCVSPQLLNGASLEGVLDQPEADLGQVGALAHPVHPTEGDHVRLSVLFRLEHISKDINSPLWGEQFHQGSSESVLHSPLE